MTNSRLLVFVTSLLLATGLLLGACAPTPTPPNLSATITGSLLDTPSSPTVEATPIPSENRITSTEKPNPAPPVSTPIPTLTPLLPSIPEFANWEAQTADCCQGFASVQSSANDLVVTAQLQAQHPNFSQGEAFAKYETVWDLTGRTVNCIVNVNDPAGFGPANSPNGAQIFLKDANFKSYYGSWHNLTSPSVSIALPPFAQASADAYIDPGFDVTKIVIVGVKIGTGSQADANYAYSGTFIISDCSIR